jgi:hypothetical protein
MNTRVLVILLIVASIASIVSSMPEKSSFGSRKGGSGFTKKKGGNDALEGLPKAAGLEETSMDISEDVIDFDTSAVSSESSESKKRKATNDDPNTVLVAASLPVEIDNAKSSTSWLYTLVKPLVDSVKVAYDKLTIPRIYKARRVEWGPMKHESLKEIIVNRVCNLFYLPHNDPYALDSQMVDAAGKYISALSLSPGGGTNFTVNDYAKNQAILSLIPIDLKNQAKFARRIGVNPKLVSRSSGTFTR